MKLIWEPTVYLIGKQVVNQDDLDDYLEDFGFNGWATESEHDAQTLVEVAGRVCYLSFKGGRDHKDYIEHILEVGHTSVVEHAVFSLLITGVSRSLTHQLVRQRAGTSYSQLSQRYVDCSDIGFVVPHAHIRYWEDHVAYRQAYLDGEENLDESPWFRGSELWIRWHTARQKNLADYAFWSEALLDDAPKELTGTDKRKWARQAARAELPECTETQIFVTGNVTAWRHFLNIRGSRHADVEIRRLANHVLEKLRPYAPDLFADYESTRLSDGTFELTTKNKKV